MTRQEQIEQEAKNHSADVLDRHWFKRGAEWADQHPQWISVEDEMPPFDLIDNGTWRCSLPVLIYDPIRGIFLGYYECDDLYGNTFWSYDNGKRPTKEVIGGYELDNVTHWMPLPASPATEGGAS